MTCFLPLIANYSLMSESSKLVMINLILRQLSSDYKKNRSGTYTAWNLIQFGITRKTDPVCIQRETSLKSWNNVFSNTTADEKDKSLNNILLNIFRNFILNKVIKVDYNILTGWILRLFHPWEIDLNRPKGITLTNWRE